MVDVVFYEKPGCINNKKQKKILRQAGHNLQEKNLITEPWTAAKLLAFFNNLPVHAWFNQSAPAVKSGEINPGMLTAEQAIECMLKEPLLIRRPLMEISDHKLVGFEADQLDGLLTLDSSIAGNLEECPREHWESNCESISD